MSTFTPNLGLFKYDPSTDAAQTFNIKQALNENWDKVDAAMAKALANAESYDSTQTYALGDYCTMDGKLYKCTTAITAGEAWNPDHWTETSMSEELTELARQLSESGGISMTILWENAVKSNCTFAAQTLDIDISPYKLICIEHFNGAATAELNCDVVQFINCECGATWLFACSVTSTGEWAQYVIYARRISLSNNQITFESSSNTQNGSLYSDDKRCVPFRIYGVK